MEGAIRLREPLSILSLKCTVLLSLPCLPPHFLSFSTLDLLSW